MSGLKRVWQRVAGLFTRAVVQVSDASGSVQVATVANSADNLTLEVVEPYGFTATPIPGAEAVVLSPGGDASEGIVIQIGDRRYRPKGLPAGDVCVYSASGQRIWLTPNGVVIVAPFGVRIQQVPSGMNFGISSGLVHGSGIDPLTGLTYFALGNTTSQVQAEKI